MPTPDTAAVRAAKECATWSLPNDDVEVREFWRGKAAEIISREYAPTIKAAEKCAEALEDMISFAKESGWAHVMYFREEEALAAYRKVVEPKEHNENTSTPT